MTTTDWRRSWRKRAEAAAIAGIGYPVVAALGHTLRWRVEGLDGVARGTIGWPDYPSPTPSTLDFTTRKRPGYWLSPRWKEVWFPDAFVGPMAQLLCALEEGREPEISGRDNLQTMALVDACYVSAREHRAVELGETGG